MNNHPRTLLTPTGHTFFESLFPARRDNATIYLLATVQMGGIGHGADDEYLPDEDLKEGLYWGEHSDPDDCPEQWKRGGFMLAEAIDSADGLMLIYLYRAMQGDDSFYWGFLREKSACYQFGREHGREDFMHERISTQVMWAEDKVPSSPPGKECFTDTGVAEPPTLFDTDDNRDPDRVDTDPQSIDDERGNGL